MSNFYEPAEDSNLLLETTISYLKFINKTSNQSICEIGVGSGFVISNISKQLPKNNYFGSDINPDAIVQTKDEFKKINQNVNLKNKPFFDGFPKQQFDLILFNTPYLPCENREKFEDLKLIDKAIYGGKHGYEVIEEFIYQINEHLNENGKVIMIFSSLSHLNYIEDILKKNFFEFKILKQEDVFFETLYSMQIEKSQILKELSQKLTKIKYLASGKHSTVLEGKYKNKPAIIKIGKVKDISIEALFLEKLQTQSFVPKLFFKSETYVAREKFEGVLIEKFLKTSNKDDIEIVLNQILQITQKMDKLGINKFEMTNPYKHIYIEKGLKVKMIDFERCLFTEKPKNTTQFFQYLRRFINLLKEKNINLSDVKMFEISKKYKRKMFRFTIKDIIN